MKTKVYLTVTPATLDEWMTPAIQPKGKLLRLDATFNGDYTLQLELTGDDVLGISNIYGFDPSYRNVFVSSQLLRDGMLVDNNMSVQLGGDAPHPDPLLVCPGHRVTFFATVGNNSSVREQFQVAVYADPDSNAYFFPTSGALAVFNVSMGRGELSFPVPFIVPASLPSNVTLNGFVSISSTLPWERKGYDNSARSRARPAFL